MSHKSKQFLLLAGKILVIVCCLGYLIFQLTSAEFDFKSILEFISGLPVYLYFVLPVISLASWLVESYKWQLLVRDVGWVRFRESVLHNLAANAASFITPLRAGEFATKAFYFPAYQRKKVLKAVLIGNMSQMFVTIVLGSCGIALLLHNWLLAALILVVIALFTVLFSRRLAECLRFNAFRLDGIIGLSTIRYIIFSCSWLLILSVVSQASIGVIIGSITAMYLAASILPTLQLFDVFLKWTIGSFFIGYLNIPLEVMTVVVGVIWLNNQVFPVLVGCVLLGFQRFPKLSTA